MKVTFVLFIVSFLVFTLCFLYINFRYKLKQYYHHFNLEEHDLTIQQVPVNIVKASSVKNALYELNDLVVIHEIPEANTFKVLDKFILVESFLKSFSRMGTELLIHRQQDQQSSLLFDVTERVNGLLTTTTPPPTTPSHFLFVALQLNNDATFFLKIIKNNMEYIIKLTKASVIIISWQLFHSCDFIEIINEKRDDEQKNKLDINLWIMKDNLMNIFL